MKTLNFAYRRRTKLILSVLGVWLALGSSENAQALVLTGTGTVADKTVSAEATFTLVNANTLQILLRHTGTLDNYSVAQVLNDISFNMAGADITGGTVTVATGSTLYGGCTGQCTPTAIGTGGTDVSANFGYGENVSVGSPETQFGFIISASNDASTNTTFTPFSGSTGLDGDDYSLINAASFDESGIRNKEKIVDAVLITLTGTGFNLANLENPYFSFGSEHDFVAAVPEPSTLLLLGSALAGLGFFRRFRA